MTYRDDEWGRVGAAITARMLEVIPPLSQADLIKKSGVSEATVRPLMKGQPGNYRPITLGKVAVALGWTPDSIDRIGRGEPPVLLGEGPPILTSVSFDRGEAVISAMSEGKLVALDRMPGEEIAAGLARTLIEQRGAQDADEILARAHELVGTLSEEGHLDIRLAASGELPTEPYAPGDPSSDVDPEPEGP